MVFLEELGATGNKVCGYPLHCSHPWGIVLSSSFNSNPQPLAPLLKKLAGVGHKICCGLLHAVSAILRSEPCLLQGSFDTPCTPKQLQHCRVISATVHSRLMLHFACMCSILHVCVEDETVCVHHHAIFHNLFGINCLPDSLRLPEEECKHDEACT